MSKKQNGQKKPFVARIAGYGARRVSPTHEHMRRRYHIETLSYAVRGALRVQRIDATAARQGWQGRYEDGGREAFDAMCRAEGVDTAALRRIAQWHLVSMIVYMAAAVGMLVFGFIQALHHDLTLSIMSVSYMAIVPVLIMMALRHGYARWQIAERRFGGLGEYLRGRWA